MSSSELSVANAPAPRPVRSGSYWQRAQDYARSGLRVDLLAGLVVAMVGAPQCMAYAAIAGLNPIYGLYTGIVPTILGALLGASRYLVTGPSNATALVTISVLLPLAHSDHFLDYVFALAIVSGVMKLLAGLLKLGSIARFVSNSVLTGFLAGASVQIILTQVGNFMGLPRSLGGDTFSLLSAIFKGLLHFHPLSLVTGVVAVVIIIAARRLRLSAAGPLVAVVAAALLVRLAGWANGGVMLVPEVPPVHGLALAWHVPQISLGDVPVLVNAAIPVALLSMIEAISVAKSLCISTGDTLETSREFIAQGVASMVGGFFQCMPSSGSPTRTAVAYSSGARSRLAAAFSGVVILVALTALAPAIHMIPVSSLAAVVIVSALGLFNVRQLRITLQTSPTSRAVCLITLVTALLVPMQYAIYIGVLLSIGIYLYESSRLRITSLHFDNDGQVIEEPLAALMGNTPATVTINVQGSLYFAAAEQLEQAVAQVLDGGSKVIILRLRDTGELASTGVTTLRAIMRRARSHSAEILICGADPTVTCRLEASGLLAELGADHFFPAEPTLFASARRALAYAKTVDSTLAPQMQ